MSAQATTLINNIKQQIIAPIILLLFVLSLVLFFWGVAEFIKEAGNEQARQVGRDHMLWGIIGIFIMAGAWGIITIALNSFGVDVGAVPAGLGL